MTIIARQSTKNLHIRLHSFLSCDSLHTNAQAVHKGPSVHAGDIQEERMSACRAPIKILYECYLSLGEHLTRSLDDRFKRSIINEQFK